MANTFAWAGRFFPVHGCDASWLGIAAVQCADCQPVLHTLVQPSYMIDPIGAPYILNDMF
eukprot:363364-Chlamydomonas_euryale.AAC.3